MTFCLDCFFLRGGGEEGRFLQKRLMPLINYDPGDLRDHRHQHGSLVVALIMVSGDNMDHTHRHSLWLQ